MLQCSITISYVFAYDIVTYNIICKNIRYCMYMSPSLYYIVCPTYDITCWQESRWGGGCHDHDDRYCHCARAHTALPARAVWRRMGGAEPGETVAATGASHRAHCHDEVALKYMPLHTGWLQQPGGLSKSPCPACSEGPQRRSLAHPVV